MNQIQAMQLHTSYFLVKKKSLSREQICMLWYNAFLILEHENYYSTFHKLH